MQHFFFWGSLSAGQAFINSAVPDPSDTAIPIQNSATMPMSRVSLPSAHLPCCTQLQNPIAPTASLLSVTRDNCRHRTAAEILMRRGVSVVLIFFRPITWSTQLLPDLATRQAGEEMGIKPRSCVSAQSGIPLGSLGEPAIQMQK